MFIFKNKEKGASGSTRVGIIGDGQLNNGKGFSTNTVKTSKYTWYNFVFLNLLGQFRRVANVYFLVQGILMSIGWYAPHIFQSPVNPWSTIGTLLFVLSVTLIKDGVEDATRHQADRIENGRLVTVVRNGEEVSIPNHAVRVGDWMKVNNREQFPADLVAVMSSDKNDQLFVETANIDGETNLKIRKTVRDFISPETNPINLPVDAAVFECDLPNKHIHHFNGTIICNSDQRKLPVSQENFLLRGSVLRNTAWIYGFVVYTGRETKIMKNMTKAPSKLSNIERTVNKIIFLIFFSQILLVIVSVIISAQIRSRGLDENIWTQILGQGAGAGEVLLPFGLAQFLSFFILYSQMVPISLYVTMEMVNLAQGYFVTNDALMVYTEGKGKNKDIIRPECRDSKLCQEIGQIEYIFSDKTGTLTRNVMEFKKCSVGGNLYDSLEKAHAALGAVSSDSDLSMFFQLLAVCHTVIPDYINPEVTYQSPKLKYDMLRKYVKYEAESPDEGALVNATAQVGFAFMYRTPDSVVVMDAAGNRHKYDIIAINAFNSTRKRMSVVVRTPEGKVYLMCKGADNVIIERSIDKKEKLRVFDEHLTSFANEGLRTLLCAIRPLDEKELTDWLNAYKKAELVVNNREEELANVAAMVEQKMTIIGATAIEDKLQEGVPETIANLAEAGIRLWVLTGDKMETAINIGYGAKILTKEMRVVILKCDTEKQLEAELLELKKVVNLSKNVKFLSRLRQKFRKKRRKGSEKALNEKKDLVSAMGISAEINDTAETQDEIEIAIEDGEIALNGSIQQPEESADADEMPSDAFSIVIDGATFKLVTENPDICSLFLRIAKMSKSVIACRVSPAQKAEFVKLFKTKVTLAIGDGANDVSMIQAAKIGVGIKGKEGRQAVNSADFAIGQFRFLERLLLLHGRWNYRRMSKVILVSFYKNVALVITLFIYNFYTLMSGLSLYDSFVYAGFNFFTGMPPLLIGFFDKDLKESTILKMPFFYFTGREGVHLNSKKMTQWIMRAIVTAVIVTIIPLVSYQEDLGVPTQINDDISGLQAYGTLVFSALFVAVMYTIALETQTWNAVNTFFFFGSYLFYIMVISALANVPSFYIEYYGVANNILASGYYWLNSFFIGTAVLVAELAFKFFRLSFSPADLDIAIEIDHGYTKLCTFEEFQYILQHGKIDEAVMRTEAVKSAFLSRTSFQKQDRNSARLASRTNSYAE